MPTPDHDPIDELRASRPHIADATVDPHSTHARAVHDAIVTTPVLDGAARATASPRARWLVAAAAGTAAAVAVGTFALRDDARRPAHQRRVTAPSTTSTRAHARLLPADVQLVAARSAAALHTGRAHTTWSSSTGQGGGTGDIAFNGDDYEMQLHFDGDARSPGFTAMNRFVGGEFYLYDGPIGAKHWIHDTGDGAGSARDFYTIDPRTAMTLLGAGANLVEVGDATIDGVVATQWRATTPHGISIVGLGLGSIDGTTVTALDVWTDADHVVRKLDLTTSTTTEEYAADALRRTPDGKIEIQLKDGSTVTVDKGQSLAGLDLPMEKVTTTTSYSATFSDLGAPITIAAPPGAVDVEGKG